MKEMNNRILLVEDDLEIIKNLTAFLKEEGFDIFSVAGQKDALNYLEEKAAETDLVLLDVSLKDGNGFSVCAAIKATSELPVIFLTASGDEYSVVTGLDLGADDYIGKPFRPRELLSRIRSVLRRCGKSISVLELGDIRIDTASGTVQKMGQEIFFPHWNTACCFFLPITKEKCFPGQGCWRKYGMPPENLLTITLLPSISKDYGKK